MRTKPKYTDADNNPFWNWNGNNKRINGKKKQFPVTEFLQENYRKLEENLLGPGFGVGIGCGIGAGFALVGGVGLPWSENRTKLVLGVGMGCGVGLGFGYGQGLGYGYGLDSLSESFDSKPSSDSKNRFALDI